MTQQYHDLNKQGLDLQQKGLNLQQQQLNLNERMRKQNLALGLTKAAIDIGKIVGELIEQKANQNRQEGIKEYEKYKEEAIANGYNPYVKVMGKDGNEHMRYIGFGNYTLPDGRYLEDLRDETIENVGKSYLTKGGKERGMQLTKLAFDDIELGAQKQTAAKAMGDRQNVFDQERKNAMDFFVKTGDSTELQSLYDSAAWMSPDQKKAGILEDIRQANFNVAVNTAMQIGSTQGMAEVKEYLKSENFTEDQIAQIINHAQNASNQAGAVATDMAKDTYDQTEGSTGQKFQAAVAASKSGNADASDAGRKAAEQRRHRDNQNEWEKKLADMNDISVFNKDLKNSFYNFKDGDEDYYEDLMRRAKAQAESRGALSKPVELASEYEQAYYAGDMGGEDAAACILSMPGLPTAEAAKMVNRMLNHQYNGNTDVSRALDKWRGAAAARENGLKGNDLETMKRRNQDVERMITQRLFHGNLEFKDAMSVVESWIKGDINDDIVDRMGRIKNMEDYNRRSVDNELDWIHDPRSNEFGSRGSEWFGGEDGNMRKAAMEHSKWANEKTETMLANTDWEVVGEGFEEKERVRMFEGEDGELHQEKYRDADDLTGQYHLTVKNSKGETAVARVARDGKTLEKKTENGWEPFNLSDGRKNLIDNFETNRLNDSQKQQIDEAVRRFANDPETMDLSALAGSLESILESSNIKKYAEERKRYLAAMMEEIQIKMGVKL